MPHTRSIRSTLAALTLLPFAATACKSSTGVHLPTPPPGIGPEGGVLPSADGRALLTIPRGALASRTIIEVATVSGVLDPAAVRGSFYEVRPTTVRFAVPAALSIKVDPSLRPPGTAAADLVLGTVAGEDVTPLSGSTYGEAATAVMASVSAGGPYAATWRGFTAACAAPADREFDFWIGAWSWAAPNAFPGTEDVTRDTNGCVLRELFTDRNGARGRSISFRSPQTGKWHQTYVDNLGGRIVFEGSLIGGAMTLQSSPTERTRWIPADANTIRVEFQSTTDGGQSWRTGSAGTFTRR